MPSWLGCLTGRGAFGEQLEDLELPGGERLERAWPGLALEEEPLELARGEQDLSLRRGANAFDDLVERPVLREVADRAGARDVGQRRHRRIAGEDEDGGIGERRADRAGDVGAGAIGEVVVRKHDIGAELGHAADGGLHVVHDVDDLDAIRAPKRHSQQLGEEPLIVDDEHPRGAWFDPVRHAPAASPRSWPRTPVASAATTAASSSPRCTHC